MIKDSDSLAGGGTISSGAGISADVAETLVTALGASGAAVAVGIMQILGNGALDDINKLAQSLSSGGSGSLGTGDSKHTYSRYYGDSWKKTFETKSMKEIAKENDWSLGDTIKNSSNERKQFIFDANGEKIGEVHLGHKYRVDGKKVVGQDHFHLYVENKEIHHLLPDK